MYRTGSALHDRQSADGKPAARMSRLQLFLIFLIGVNVLAVLQLLSTERETLKNILFKGSRSVGLQVVPSVEVWAKGHSTISADAQIVRRYATV
jgi:cell division septal protein FtsQ